MKIPLHFSKEEKRIILMCTIRCKSYRIPFSKINFFVDTGSPDTIISQGDAIRLKVPMGKISVDSDNPITNFGGMKFQRKKCKEFNLFFKDDKESLVKLEYNPIVVECTKKDQQSLEQAYSLPSLLGVDFLTDKKLTLHFSPHKEEAYLESD